MKEQHKEILHIAVPSILSNITVPLLSLADITIMGHLGSVIYIGAIAIGSTIFNMIYWLFAFLRMGTTGMTSQAYGEKNNTECNLILYRSLITSITIAIFILLLQKPLFLFSLYIMSPADNISELAYEYFKICVWGAPPTLALYSMTGWFVGMQEARYPLFIAVSQNIINITISFILVYNFDLNIKGVAIGTVIAQYIGFLLSIYFYFQKESRLDISKKITKQLIYNKAAIKRFFNINKDIFLRTICIVCVTLYFTSSGSRQGDITLAVNALLMQYFTIYSYFMDGFAFAGEALAGKYAGAKDKSALNSIIKNIMLWGSIVAIVFTLTYTFGGTSLMKILTNDRNVQHAAKEFLPWAAVIPIAGTMTFMWDGIFIGLTATKYMLWSIVCATGVFFISYNLLFSIYGNHALWNAFILYLFTRGIMQHILYKKKVIYRTI